LKHRLTQEHLRAWGLAARGKHFAHCAGSPSAWVTPSGGWKCGECGAYGDAADLLRHVEGLSYAAARERLGCPQEAPPAREPMRALSAGARELARHIWRSLRPYAGDYWTGRGLDPAPLRGVTPRDIRSLAALTDCREGEELGLRDWLPWKLRAPGCLVPLTHPLGGGTYRWRYTPPVTTRDGRALKAISPRGRSDCVAFRRGQGGLVIVEGEPDWLAWCARTERAVMALSGGSFRPEWLALAAGPIWLATHLNQGAERVRRRIEDAAGGRHVELRQVPETDDWADRAKRGETFCN
jgi:hypothetical protein